MRVSVLAALLWGAAAAMIAAIVHIASVLILPHVASNDAFARVARLTRVGVLEILPRPAAGTPTVPFRDPALASAICRYDLHDGDLRIGAEAGDAAFLAVSFHSRRGIPFYALNNRSDSDGRIELVLLTPDRLERAEDADREDVPVHELRVSAPEPEGFVEFDALPRIGGYASARQALNSVSCKFESDP